MSNTASAAATGLPSAMHVIPPRRAFLAGLAKLPLIGGSLALLDQPAVAAEPSGFPGVDQLATLDDYAAATFEALEVDLDKVREAHGGMWTPLAMGLTLLARSPDQCRDIAASMDVDLAEAMMRSLNDGAAWYRQAADLIEAAEARYLCGAARSVKETEMGGLDA